MINQIRELILKVRPDIVFIDNEDTILYELLDSLDVIMLVDDIEKSLNILIDAEDIVPENFHSLFILKNFLERKLNEFKA